MSKTTFEESIGRLSIIVAVDMAGGFSKNNSIPWVNELWAKEDLARFQQITKGHVCIMGRKTYQDMREMRKARDRANGIKRTLIKEILPERESIVLTRKAKFKAPGARIAPNLREAVQSVPEDDRKIFVLGGEKLFVEALQWAKTIHMTIVRDYYQCDRFFPVELVNKMGFKIKEGEETDDLYFLTYTYVERTRNDKTASAGREPFWRVILNRG